MRDVQTLIINLQFGLLGLVAMLIVACGNPASPGATTGDNRPAAPADKQIFRWPKGNADFITLDPGLAQYSDSIYAIKALFSGLVGLNGKGEVVDLLTSSHQVSEDGVTYTFTLGPNLKFSYGTPHAYEDVRESL